MFVAITNTPRDYAWGSPTAIAELFGRQPSGGPEAELWLGTHPGSPTRLVDGGGLLSDVAGEPLPFLLKVLAAASPLSLQVHPTQAQAAEGFERENAAGIAIDAPDRNYRDTQHKPELIYALSERFEALCGFRATTDIRQSIERLIALDTASPEPDPGPLRALLALAGDNESLGRAFEWLISRGEGVDALVGRVVALSRAHPDEFSTVALLADAYPGDPGSVISLLLNRVTLERGQVLYLPAGNIHAYLEGLGIELMAASDNVLRGGLTTKHVDVPELLSVLDPTPLGVPFLTARRMGDHVVSFRPPVREFQLVVVDGPGVVDLSGPAILLCTDGRFAVRGAGSSATLGVGDAAFASADEGSLVVDGAGQLFVATSQ